MSIPPYFYRPAFLVELMYSALVIIACLIIYLRAKEMYNITSYKGINYFSKAFLFFAVAYFFRFFFKILFRLFVNIREIMPPAHGVKFGQIGMIIYIYASTMAALYVFYSVAWKNIKKGERDYSLLLNALGILMTVLTVFYFGPIFHIGTQFSLFAGAAAFGIFSQTKKKKGHLKGLFFVYNLLLLFWLLNVAAIELPGFLLELKLVLYAASFGLFLIILRRILKVTG